MKRYIVEAKVYEDGTRDGWWIVDTTGRAVVSARDWDTAVARAAMLAERDS